MVFRCRGCRTSEIESWFPLEESLVRCIWVLLVLNSIKSFGWTGFVSPSCRLLNSEEKFEFSSQEDLLWRKSSSLDSDRFFWSICVLPDSLLTCARGSRSSQQFLLWSWALDFDFLNSGESSGCSVRESLISKKPSFFNSETCCWAGILSSETEFEYSWQDRKPLDLNSNVPFWTVSVLASSLISKEEFECSWQELLLSRKPLDFDSNWSISTVFV